MRKSSYQSPAADALFFHFDSPILAASSQGKVSSSGPGPVSSNSAPSISEDELGAARTLISSINQCKTMAMSRSGLVIVVGKNDYFSFGTIPLELETILALCHDHGQSIDEVILKDDDHFLVIFDDYSEVAGSFPNVIGDVFYNEIKPQGLQLFSADWSDRSNYPKVISVRNPSLIRKRENLICFGCPTFISNRNYYFEDKSKDFYGGAQPFFRMMSDTTYNGWNIGDLCQTSCANDGVAIISDKYVWTAKQGEYIFEKAGEGRKVISRNYVEPNDPLYPVISGQISKPWRLKLFGHGRYFISNRDGQEFAYYI